MVRKIDDVVDKIAELSEWRKSDRPNHHDSQPDIDFVNYIVGLDDHDLSSLRVITALLDTFDDSFDDGGTQETVANVVSQVSDKVFSVAIANSKNTLEKRAPEWLEVLLEDRG